MLSVLEIVTVVDHCVKDPMSVNLIPIGFGPFKFLRNSGQKSESKKRKLG